MKEKIRIVSQKYARDNKVIRVGSKHKGKRVSIDDIIYIEASENYTFLHLKNGNRLLSSKCLKHYENLLTEQGFVRIHRSFLVHLIHIKEYEKKYRLLHLSGNTILSVSYRRKSILSKIINTKEFQSATKQVA